MSAGAPAESTAATSRVNLGESLLGRLRAVALVFVVLGAVGSIGLELRVGRNNDSVALLVLFAGWVLSPFFALVVADRLSMRWAALTRATLNWMMLILPLASLAIYSDVAFGPPRPQPASMFLIVPLGSLLLIAAVVTIAASVSRRRARRGASAHAGA